MRRDRSPTRSKRLPTRSGRLPACSDRFPACRKRSAACSNYLRRRLTQSSMVIAAAESGFTNTQLQFHRLGKPGQSVCVMESSINLRGISLGCLERFSGRRLPDSA